MALFRQSLSAVRRFPRITVTTIATLTLALGACVVVFSFLNTFLLKPLPYGDGSRIAVVYEHSLKGGQANALALTYDNLTAVEEHVAAFSRLGIFRFDSAVIHGDDTPEATFVQRVSADAFPLMGARAALGSVITPANLEVGGLRAVVLSDSLWRRRFGADPAIVGRSIRINDQSHHVVGVMPPDFVTPSRDEGTQAWLSLLRSDYTPNAQTPHRYHVRHYVWGELARGKSVAAANAELSALAATLRQQDPEHNADRGLFALSLRDDLLGGFGRQLLLLQAAVLLVLVVACFNCFCLLIAAALQRRREFAVRLALGASRRHLFAQLFAESLWVALPAAGLALVFAIYALPAGMALIPAPAQRVLQSLPRPEVDATVALVVLSAAAVIALAFSAVPLLQARRLNLEATLRDGGRSAGSPAAARAARALAAGQIAVALALLICAALLLRSQHALRRVDPGLPIAELDLFHLGLRGDHYTTNPALRLQLFERFRDELRTLPGVRDVGVASYLFAPPPRGYQGFVQEGDGLQISETPKRALPCYVLPGTFDALGLRRIDGRLLDETDVNGRPLVAVISAAFAAKYWPGQSPLGRRFRFEGLRGEWIEVVGVVSDVLGTGNQPRVLETFYITISQGAPPGLGMGFFLRHEGAVPDERSLQRALARLDPNLRIFSHESPAAIYARTAWQSVFVTRLIAAFALLAVILALAGIYAVNSFLVQRRINELGIRAALGASRQNLLNLVLGGTLRFTLVGLCVGALLAAAASRALSGLLFNVPSLDPVVYLGAALLMCLACLAATALPARRAARVDPLIALRAE